MSETEKQPDGNNMSETEKQPDGNNMSETEKYEKIGNLNSYSRGINVKVKVVEKSDPRTVFSRRDDTEHRVTEALVGDETGCIQLTLWDDIIDEITIDDVIDIKNGYINTFKGSMRLNIGRYGTHEKLEEALDEVNTENNLSKQIIQRSEGSYGGRGRSYGGRDRRPSYGRGRY